MLKRLSILVLFASLFSLSIFPAVPASPETEYPLNSHTESLINLKYFPALLKAVKSAQKSIYICMYYISYFPDKKGKTDEILNALVGAVKRGVKVEVVLDRGYQEAEDGGDLSNKNVRAYSFFKKAGIPVFYDDLKTLTHAKYFIIDESFVIAGSANLSEQAFTSNREAGFLVRSPEITKEFLDEYNTIPKFSPEPVKDAIPIPVSFLRNKDLAPKLMVNSYPRGFDFYLLCQRKSFETKSAAIKFSALEIEEYFYKGDPGKGFRANPIQRFMNEVLRKVIKKYPFIKSYRHNVENKTLEVELPSENKPAEDSLYLPSLYWSNGWDRRLSQRAQFCLFYVLDKTSSGRCGRYFSQAKYDAVKEYGVSQQIFANGTTELQRFNLIEKEINFKIGETNANGFMLNDFYAYSDFQKDLADLQTKTDPELFKTVSGLVDSVNEISDLDVYKRFISLGQKYGIAPLNKILDLCKSHQNGISPYRQFPYVEQAIINAGLGRSGVKTETNE